MGLNELVEIIVQKKLKSSEILKHIRGTVVDVDPDNNYALVDISGKQINIVNKSGEELNIADEVSVHYWTNVGNGWIAIRHGLPNSGQKGLILNTAAVVSTYQADRITADTEAIATYDNMIAKYGDVSNKVLVNGYVVYPVTVSQSSIENKDASYVNMVKSASINYREVTLDDITYKEEPVEKELITSNGSLIWSDHYALINKKTNKILAPDNIKLYSSSPSIRLFYKGIHSPVVSSNYPNGYVDMLLIDYRGSSDYKPIYIELTVGFQSKAEYEFAIATSTKSEITG